nr:ATP-dependent Clp protease proteolytic subunit [Jacquemontia paniculata]
MPVGVPKVPFRSPGEEDASWTDIYNRLYRERCLFLTQEIDSEIANQIIGLVVYLTIEDQTQDQFLFINSPGGGIISGIGIFNIIDVVPPYVHTIALGLAASMASFILAGGEPTKRLAFPHTRVMVHQPASSLLEAQTGEVILETGELVKLHEYLIRVYALRTGQPQSTLATDMERDFFLSATEAKAYGIVDAVGFDLS